mmetsp:Transcript_2635/g.6053  ORF Transcript_2635/g.6053 Transcript_2635/m.6053 type:complete len:285 (+) Transcript_2635:404-1258(+)
MMATPGRRRRRGRPRRRRRCPENRRANPPPASKKSAPEVSPTASLRGCGPAGASSAARRPPSHQARYRGRHPQSRRATRLASTATFLRREGPAAPSEAPCTSRPSPPRRRFRGSVPAWTRRDREAGSSAPGGRPRTPPSRIAVTPRLRLEGRSRTPSPCRTITQSLRRRAGPSRTCLREGSPQPLRPGGTRQGPSRARSSSRWPSSCRSGIRSGGSRRTARGAVAAPLPLRRNEKTDQGLDPSCIHKRMTLPRFGDLRRNENSDQGPDPSCVHQQMTPPRSGAV